MGLFMRRKTVFVDSDILVIGGGMAGCGATYESRLIEAVVRLDEQPVPTKGKGRSAERRL